MKKTNYEPAKMKTFIIKSGQKCRLSATTKTDNGYISTIYIFDTNTFVDVKHEKIEKYLF